MDECLGLYLEIRVDNISENYFNAQTGNIDIRRIVNDGFVNVSDVGSEANKRYVNEKVSEYRNNIVINTEENSIHIDERKHLKNSTVVRWIHIIRAHAGRLIGDD